MKQKELTYIAVSVFLLILMWIIFSIYHNSVTSTITPLVNTQIIPISPTFDTRTVDNLKKRESVSPIFEFEGTSATPTTESAVSSQSAKTLP